MIRTKEKKVAVKKVHTSWDRIVSVSTNQLSNVWCRAFDYWQPKPLADKTERNEIEADNVGKKVGT